MFLFARELWFYQNDKQEKLVEEEKNEKLKKKQIIKQQWAKRQLVSCYDAKRLVALFSFICIV